MRGRAQIRSERNKSVSYDLDIHLWPTKDISRVYTLSIIFIHLYEYRYIHTDVHIQIKIYLQVYLQKMMHQASAWRQRIN